MKPDFSLVTVCTEAYSMEYLRKLVKSLSEKTEYTFDAYCITDRPNELPDGVKAIEQALPVSGWWNKVQVYDGSTMPEGWVLYMDLDIVILKNFDHVIRRVTEAGNVRTIYAVSDAIKWRDNSYSSSCMMLQPQHHRYIWKKFKKNYREIVKDPGGDQVWVGKNMTPVVEYIDRHDPHLKANLKFHLGKREGGGWRFPLSIDSRIRMVDCGGRPKPHQLEYLPYIKQNWTVL